MLFSARDLHALRRDDPELGTVTAGVKQDHLDVVADHHALLGAAFYDEPEWLHGFAFGFGWGGGWLDHASQIPGNQLPGKRSSPARRRMAGRGNWVQPYPVVPSDPKLRALYTLLDRIGPHDDSRVLKAIRQRRRQLELADSSDPRVSGWQPSQEPRETAEPDRHVPPLRPA